METKEIIENNKLIAEFMEWKEYVNDRGILIYKKGEDLKSISQLNYSTSWDWLMPVVVKCFGVNVNNNDDFSFKLNDALLETNIKTLYNAVIEFIKWYNLNK